MRKLLVYAATDDTRMPSTSTSSFFISPHDCVVQCVVNKLLQVRFHQNSTKSILLLQTKIRLIVPNIMQMAINKTKKKFCSWDDVVASEFSEILAWTP